MVRQFSHIDRIVYFDVAGDPTVPAWFADEQFIHTAARNGAKLRRNELSTQSVKTLVAVMNQLGMESGSWLSDAHPLLTKASTPNPLAGDRKVSQMLFRLLRDQRAAVKQERHRQ